MAILTYTQQLTNFISRFFFFWLPTERRPFSNLSSSTLPTTTTTSSSSSAPQDASRGITIKALKYLLPLFWPKQWSLRIVLFFAALCMVADRLFKLFVPIVYGSAIQSLTNGQFPLGEMIIYFFLSVGSNSISDVQDTIFLKQKQYLTRAISLRTYSHLHRLSLRWHLNRNTGATLRVIDRGISSASSVIDLVCFEFLPTLLDFALVCIILFYKYGGIYSVIVLLTLASYVGLTFSITEWRTKFRRQTNESENELNQLTVDALLNFETVKYFTAEKHETKRYSDAQQRMFENQQLGRLSLTFLNFVQNLIKAISFSTSMMLAGYRVVQPGSSMDIGDMVTILTYINQVFRPLNWLGTSYRQINQNFVDMEKLFELMEQPLEIKDVPKAPALKVIEGSVTFENVSFSYDGKAPTLNNVSFTIHPGQTVAIVGPSGAGKSTVARLLLRFYAANSGRILIDGQDISKVTQLSLRENVGIVPQDTVLFNDTMLYNIGYGNREASVQQIEEAAQRARIHEFIMSNKAPDHYQTKVGERGLRLSGGEKQRVAIARAILKDPPILILDEATSSLDSHTEKEIQASLLEITRGRTAMVIAHRLSTIVKAHQILVLKDGSIIEQGTHSQLLSLGGQYASLWLQQSNALVHDSTDAPQEFYPKFPPPEDSTTYSSPSLSVPKSTPVDQDIIDEEIGIEIETENESKNNKNPNSFFNPFDLLTKKKTEQFEEIELTTIPKLEPPPSTNLSNNQSNRSPLIDPNSEKKEVVIDLDPLLSGQ